VNEKLDDIYRSIFDDTTEALAVVTTDGRLLVANRAARLLGVDLEALPVSTDASFRRLTLPLTDRAGGARVLSMDEHPLGANRLLVLRDVTRQGGSDEGQSHHRQIESIGYLTASVVHDFNNLLVPILCTSALLESELLHDPRGVMAGEVRLAAERATELVHGLMRLARKQPPALQRVDVNAVIADIAPLLRRGLPENVALELVLDDALLEVVVDRHKFEVALLNLVANARDAMPDGGNIVVTTTSRRAVVGHGPSVVGHACIVVADDGQGMSPDVRDRAFERFFTTKAPGKGTGLGLPGVESFATECGGQVSLESQLGRGTTVTLCLPLAARVEEEPASAKQGVELPAGSETVLVVEDDDAVRYAIRSVLERYGYSVIDATSGEEALRLLGHERRVALAIVDVVMPSMSGRDLVARLRAGDHPPKVLYMSGHLDATLGTRPGFGTRDRVLRKAFSPSELLRNVRRTLDGP